MVVAPLGMLILGFGFLSVIAHLHLHVSTMGFSAELIHRDSPGSPFYDPTSTPSSRLQASIHRSTTRASYFRRAKSPNSISPHDIEMSSPITNDNFEFLMIMWLGSNETKIITFMDTGSSLFWVKCDPCPNCFKHNNAIFDTTYSDSYKKLPCHRDPCFFLDEWSCDDDRNCEYHSKYIDNSSVNGLLSTETLTFKSTTQKVHVDNVVFGCTHHIRGDFNMKSIGIFGLGYGRISFLRHLNSSFGNKFGYCLPVITNKFSRIYFGSAAVFSNLMAMTTPLFIKRKYYLKLEVIKVEGADDNPIIVEPNPSRSSGNIIIDTGTMYTSIDNVVMQKLRLVLIDCIPFPPINRAPISPPIEHAPPIRPVPKVVLDDDIDYFDLCFNTSGARRHIRMPKIMFHFANDLVITLNKNQAFIVVNKDIICLIIISKDEKTSSVFGAYGQLGSLMVYDLYNEELTVHEQFC